MTYVTTVAAKKRKNAHAMRRMTKVVTGPDRSQGRPRIVSIDGTRLTDEDTSREDRNLSLIDHQGKGGFNARVLRSPGRPRSGRGRECRLRSSVRSRTVGIVHRPARPH